MCEDCAALVDTSMIVPQAPKRERSDAQKAGAKKGAEKRKAKLAAQKAKAAAAAAKAAKAAGKTASPVTTTGASQTAAGPAPSAAPTPAPPAAGPSVTAAAVASPAAASTATATPSSTPAPKPKKTPKPRQPKKKLATQPVQVQAQPPTQDQPIAGGSAPHPMPQSIDAAATNAAPGPQQPPYQQQQPYMTAYGPPHPLSGPSGTGATVPPIFYNQQRPQQPTQQQQHFAHLQMLQQQQRLHTQSGSPQPGQQPMHLPQQSPYPGSPYGQQVQRPQQQPPTPSSAAASAARPPPQSPATFQINVNGMTFPQSNNFANYTPPVHLAQRPSMSPSAAGAGARGGAGPTGSPHGVNRMPSPSMLTGGAFAQKQSPSPFPGSGLSPRVHSYQAPTTYGGPTNSVAPGAPSPLSYQHQTGSPGLNSHRPMSPQPGSVQQQSQGQSQYPTAQQQQQQQRPPSAGLPPLPPFPSTSSSTFNASTLPPRPQ